jgi:signal transduction histidine kinase/CheY-like chemotaxis protein/HPt (histidine-containing phosphotransfer) domain-containing protein
MTKYKVEIQITLVAIIIAAVVFTFGHFSYTNLSKIVYSIQTEAKPDNKLFVIKNIAAELTTLEHTLRLYLLTNNDEDLEQYNSHQKQIILNLRKLNVYKGKFNTEAALIDSIGKLSMEKLELWHQVFTLHLSNKSNPASFSKIYSALDNAKTDTITSEMIKNKAPIEIAGTDTFIIERSPEFNAIKQKIKTLEKELSQKGKQTNVLESQLMEKNLVIGIRINQLIAEAETRAENDFKVKTVEANRLAAITHKWLALFSYTAALLLLIALFVLFTYLKKTRIYQRALTEASKKAEKLARAKEQFAANVSHELRTPVNAIYGLTEQLHQKNNSAETNEMISAIFKSASHLKNIVNDTLDFSKIQAGKIKFDEAVFSPDELFEDVYTLQKFEAKLKGIPIYFDWEGEKPEAVIGDPLRLKQILINLVSNAIKFTEKGEVQIKVICSKNPGKIYQFEIQITDTGIGMNKNDIELIFDEYYQIESNTGKKFSGTGLGLSIVKKLVEMQNGTIEIVSNPGKGTKVTVILSYWEGQKIIQKITAETNLIIPKSLQSLNILIADDEEYNRFLIKSILQKWGIRFKEVQSGNEAVAEIKHEHFDIILMDLNMPGINGIEAAKTITANNSKVAIIATTAVNEQSDKQACIVAGMKGYLLKPFTEKDLFDAVNSVLQPVPEHLHDEIISQIKPDELLHLANGDMKFLEEMIRLFIKSAETGIANIESAIMDKNREMIFENAHKMAAPTKHIGAKNLYNNIKNLEKILKENEPWELVFTNFQIIKKEFTALKQLFSSYLVEVET